MDTLLPARLRSICMLALALVFCLPAGPAVAQEGGVYISGQGASLGDALDQALAENGNGPKQPFWIIVSGYDIVQLTKAAISGDTREQLQRIRERRGLVYVCQADLDFYGIKETELVIGVKSIRGAALNGPAQKQRGIVLPKSDANTRLIMRACADRDESDARGALWTGLHGIADGGAAQRH